MVGHGFLFTLPVSFFDNAQSVGSPDDAHGIELPTAGLAADGRPTEGLGSDDAASVSTNSPASAWNESGATCIACGIGANSQGFTSAAEQRQHFKTDWHRYNLKRRLDKKPPVTEQEFDAMIEQGDDVSSISGSDTESSQEDDSDTESSRQQQQANASIQGAQAVFKAADGTAFGVWRCLLMPDSHKHKQDEPSSQQLLQLLRQLRRSPTVGKASDNPPAAEAASNSSEQQADTSGYIWTLFMLRGGHFAAAVVRINSPSSSSAVPAALEAAAEGSSQQQQQHSNSQRASPAVEPFHVLAHKTFHRYVVRAKAGGKQSTKDATGKYARSAGSRLRRYNEAALQRDITQLLKDWAPYLAASQLIFLAAPGSNSRVLFTAAADVATLGGAGAGLGFKGIAGQQGLGVLNSADPRVRRVPFVTQRPTFSELKRVLLVLGNVRAVQLPTTTEQQQPETQQQPKKQQPQQQLQEMAAATVAGIAPAGASRKQEEPPLVKASKAGDAERVARLLANGHDPTIRDSKGRSPYQLAANKEVRDAFRRFMAQQPDAWDYNRTDIPSPLTDELAATQQSKKADKKARQKAKVKERKEAKATTTGSTGSHAAAVDTFDDELAAALAEAAVVSSRAAVIGKSKQVGGRAGNDKKDADAACSKPNTAEVAQRREQLAAAAEARLKALQQKQQLW